jgi:hypothetical protein
MDPHYIIMLIPAGGFLGLVGLVYMSVAVVRARMAPRCWKCGAAKVVHSQSHRVFDLLAGACLLTPLRCKGCRTRFYGFRWIQSRPQPISLRLRHVR